MRTYVSHLKISEMPVGDKNEFSKNINKKLYKHEKESIYFFIQDKSFGNETKAPAGRRTAQKKSLKT